MTEQRSPTSTYEITVFSAAAVDEFHRARATLDFSTTYTEVYPPLGAPTELTITGHLSNDSQLREVCDRVRAIDVLPPRAP